MRLDFDVQLHLFDSILVPIALLFLQIHVFIDDHQCVVSGRRPPEDGGLERPFTWRGSTGCGKWKLRGIKSGR